MPVWQWAADAAGVVLVLVVLYAFWLLVRRRLICRHGGTFEFCVRAQPVSAGRGWVLGVGRYSGDVLEWFRIFSVLPRPSRKWQRAELAFQGRRDPGEMERRALYDGQVIAQCATSDGPVEVAMSADALTGFLAWLEAAPPGQQLRSRQT
ncbi:MAG: DUF2550 domain-containing protein [Nocardioidaceae bacterium]|nr:MAG: DUF2550 domain-containing protein [Nocardioidaceae bacterium]